MLTRDLFAVANLLVGRGVYKPLITVVVLYFQRVRSACRPRLRSRHPSVVMEIDVNLTGSKQSLHNGDVTVPNDADDKDCRISIRL